MSTTNAFVWLTGTVTIPADAPANWETEGLGEFYNNPNDDRWGGALCRVLYHESIHFWQILSSGFIANALADEWLRLQHFEQTGELRPASDIVKRMYDRGDGEPFSAMELVECWARYWDVHTRSPARTVAEEGIDVPASLRLHRGDGIESAYTSGAYDLFMQQGSDAELYAAPYRWLLEQCNGNSRFANVILPPLIFHAFGTQDPVAMFQASLRKALEPDIVTAVMQHSTGNINFDWLNQWGAIVGQVVEPARAQLGLASFTGGWDVIARGPLGTHPIYGAYLQRLRGFGGIVQQIQTTEPTERSIDAMYEFAIRDFARKDPQAVFGMPGQPLYRWMLGEYLSPPRIRFSNYDFFAEVVHGARVVLKINETMGRNNEAVDPTFATSFNGLDERVAEFRTAEYAVSLGLPPDAFKPREAVTN